MTLKKLLYPPVDMCADIDRMAAEIQRDFCGGDPDSFALIGLYKQGVPLAERMSETETVLKKFPALNSLS